jgi:hypothetical protein
MNKKEANRVVYSAVNAAMLKGCYSLEDAAVIIEALKVSLTEEEE